MVLAIYMSTIVKIKHTLSSFLRIISYTRRFAADCLRNKTFLQPISSAKVGQTFLLGYREIQGRNILYRWTEIVPTHAYELVDAPQIVDLPGTIPELIDSISNAKSCKVRTPGLDVAEKMLTDRWGSSECGFDSVKSEPTPAINEGNDL